MWPWWILSNISFRIEVEIRILSPLRMIPFSSDSSSLTSQYMRVLLLIQALILSGHPRLMISMRSFSDSSLAVSSRILQVWVLRLASLTVSGEFVVQFPLPRCWYLLSQEVVRGTACLGVLTPFRAYILACSRTFAKFFVVWVVLSLRVSSQLFLGVCDLILRALSFHTCIGWIAPGWTKLRKVPFLSEHILIRPQLKILMHSKPRDNCLSARLRRGL